MSNHIFANSNNTVINTNDGTLESQQLALIYATERVGFKEKLFSFAGLNSEMQLDFVSMGGNSGSQSSRLQIEATADGTLHVVGASDGVGEYTMTFLDGPFNAGEVQKYNQKGFLEKTWDRVSKAAKKTVINDTSSVLSFYAKRKEDIKNREVTIYIFNRYQGQSGFWSGLENLTTERWTTFSSIAFNGIVQNIEIGLKTLPNNSFAVQVGLKLIGGWRT